MGTQKQILSVRVVWLVVVVSLWLPLMGLADEPTASAEPTAPLVIVAQLLHAAEGTGDAGAAREAAIAFYRQYPEATRNVFGVTAKALERDDWREILPQSRRAVQHLGQNFTYEVSGGPLAPLARTLVNDLSVRSMNRQKALASRLAQLYPESRIFAFLAEGIAHVDRQNEAYAKSYLQGNTLLLELRRELERLQSGGTVEGVTATTPELTRRRLREDALAKVRKHIAEAEALVKQGENYLPLDAGLRELTIVAHESIDELEAIGDL